MLEELRRHREMVQGRIQKSFESDGLDVNSLIKSEGYDIEKAQENEYTEYSVNALIKAGVLEYDDSIEKAVYADTPQNRKLGRVGQEYHRGKGKKVEEKSAKKGVKTEEKKPTDKKQQSNNQKSLDFQSAVNFLEENADWWILYEDDSLDEDDEKERELKEKFESIKKFITKFKTFLIHSEKQEEKAKQYKKDMEAKGFKLVDFGQGSGIVHYAILKNK